MIKKERNTSAMDVCITLASRSIMTVDSVDWTQIMEFRRDEDAKEKLRRFRLLVNANTAGGGGA